MSDKLPLIETALGDLLKEIFNCKKVSFDDPGIMQEQECLFINVTNSPVWYVDGEMNSKVTGELMIYGNNRKLPLGFYSEKINNAAADLKKNFFFNQIDENTKTFQNIVQRGCSFVYFFNDQYDPDIGTITDITFTEEMT